jgi:hypothetical protein
MAQQQQQQQQQQVCERGAKQRQSVHTQQTPAHTLTGQMSSPWQEQRETRSATMSMVSAVIRIGAVILRNSGSRLTHMLLFTESLPEIVGQLSWVVGQPRVCVL